MQKWEAHFALPKRTLSICLDRNYFPAPLGDKVHCSQDPQPHYSEKKNIKNGSHDTIHTFKNYFGTMFSVFSFQQNKLYPNES